MNLKQLVSILALVPQLFSIVNATVQGIEAAIPDFAGSDKLKAAEAQVNVILSAAISDVGVLTSAIPAVTTLINAAVAAFNAAGLFKHAPKIGQPANIA